MTEHYNKSMMKQRRKALRNAMTQAEVILWSKLSRRQIHGYKFRRQYSVDQYVIDFYCPELKLAVEVDGDSHFKNGAEAYDAVRQEYIESFGIRFFRCTNNDVCTNLDGVCQSLYDEIEKLRQNAEHVVQELNP
jgi:very-short-patch-repair endonuclease